MQTSGKPTEGFMTLVPLTIIVVVVIFALGGPTEFMRDVTGWMRDLSGFLGRWVRTL